MVTNKKNNIKLFRIIAISIILVFFISILKYREGEINYRCSDATWHALLTIEAYNQTPISVHKFLPIVSLGRDTDKNITWGATIPDAHGNYYYTSFSPAGYVLPYFFIKIFGLSISEKSLYIFNTLLFAASTALWGCLIFKIYKKTKHSLIISIIGVLTYVLSPEILHGMGIVFWHQSIMQLTLLIQIFAYYNMKTTNTKSSKIIFYAMTLINPYIEWTGYVANIGFALAELISNWKKNKKKAFLLASIIGLITISSFVLFSLHYLSAVNSNIFFQALKDRFMSRNTSSGIPLVNVFSGYLSSFLYLWVLLLVLIVWNFMKKGTIKLRHGLLFLILFFPIIENIIMSQHAFEYSYDRMKLIYGLSFLICELVYELLRHSKKKYIFSIAIVSIVIATGILNLKSYVNDITYIWNTDYRNNNIVFADYINNNYDDFILGSNVAVRGYVNLLFKKGIYEGAYEEFIKEKAINNDKDYAILLKFTQQPWNIDRLEEVIVYSSKKDKIEILRLCEGKICVSSI